MGDLKKLIEESKIKYIGLSEASTSTIKRAHVVHLVTAVQNKGYFFQHVKLQIFYILKYRSVRIACFP